MAGCLPLPRLRHSKPDKCQCQQVERLVEGMKSRGLKLLALDFDLTLIDIHTYGEWKDSVEALAEHMRPCMRDLMEAALNRGMLVCIVTFNSKAWLIRSVLQAVFHKKVAKQVYVEATPSHVVKRTHPGESLPGKEYHLKKVVEEIQAKEQLNVAPEEILLLDDDMDNVKAAISFGHRSMQVLNKDAVGRPKPVNYDSLDSFERMLRIAG